MLYVTGGYEALHNKNLIWVDWQPYILVLHLWDFFSRSEKLFLNGNRCDD